MLRATFDTEPLIPDGRDRCRDARNMHRNERRSCSARFSSFQDFLLFLKLLVAPQNFRYGYVIITLGSMNRIVAFSARAFKKFAHRAVFPENTCPERFDPTFISNGCQFTEQDRSHPSPPRRFMNDESDFCRFAIVIEIKPADRSEFVILVKKPQRKIPFRIDRRQSVGRFVAHSFPTMTISQTDRFFVMRIKELMQSTHVARMNRTKPKTAALEVKNF